MTILEVTSLSKSFRGLKAVSEVAFSIPRGAIHSLIGPNGAGKTTSFNLIAGAIQPDEGQVLLNGKNITGLRPDQICAAGIGRTFQLVKPFLGLNVVENVMVGALLREKQVSKAEAKALEILELLEMGEKAYSPAASLTLPERKRLEVARALATQPQLLLLDEVMAGLRPGEIDRMVEILRKLNRETGLSILLIEHVMRAVMALSEKVIVLSFGQKICEGSPQEVTQNPQVIQCYLGEGAL